MNTSWQRLDRSVDRASPVFALAVVVAVLWLGLTFGSRAATGADAFGYVSQAYLWLKGDLRIEQPLSREFPWPLREESLTPLGYRPGQSRHTIVPTYAPGVPLIMAAFHLAFGNCGPYYVTPVFGALLVAGTFVLAYRVTRSRLTATVAAVLMAGSPAFLFNLMFPMSDTVTAALWTWSLALLTWPRVAAALGAGFAAGLAVLARPNLVPLAVAGAAAAMLWSDDAAPLSRRAIRVLAFSASVVLAALFIAAVNRTLYGSPFVSGYGRTSSLYALAHFRTNVLQFATWLTESESVGVLLALCPLLSKRCRGGWLTWRTGLPLAAFAAIGCASYLFYLPFDQWWYLRFLLPVFPILFLMLAAAVVTLSRAVPVRSAAAVLVVILGLLTAYRLAFVSTREFLKLGYGEQRYIAVGQFIDRVLPANAVVLSMQHSGSIRYYSGRLTIRYDVFSPERFPSVIGWLQARGYRPYILLEDWEEEKYRARFGTDNALARLEIRVLAEMTQPVRIRLYDPVPSPGVNPPPDPISIRVSRQCAGPRGVWER
jgi:hypothetical protein